MKSNEEKCPGCTGSESKVCDDDCPIVKAGITDWTDGEVALDNLVGFLKRLQSSQFRGMRNGDETVTILVGPAINVVTEAIEALGEFVQSCPTKEEE